MDHASTSFIPLQKDSVDYHQISLRPNLVCPHCYCTFTHCAVSNHCVVWWCLCVHAKGRAPRLLSLEEVLILLIALPHVTSPCLAVSVDDYSRPLLPVNGKKRRSLFGLQMGHPKFPRESPTNFDNSLTSPTHDVEFGLNLEPRKVQDIEIGALLQLTAEKFKEKDISCCRKQR